METLRKGFDGFTLKMIALILMTFDHIASFMWGALDIPIWFHWLGRISAPLFIFMVVEGFCHTSNRKKYIFRLYLWSVGMAIGNQLVSYLMPHPENTIIINNIFATMFLITLYLQGVEWIKAIKEEKDKKKFILGLAMLIVPIVLGMGVLLTLGSMTRSVMVLIMTFVPTPFLVEGSIVWIALGILLYLFRGKKISLSISYSVLCMLTLIIVLSGGFTFENLFLLNYQWLMILALPFMLLYNGQKGKSMKHFFYIYYPLHIYGFYILGILFLNK